MLKSLFGDLQSSKDAVLNTKSSAEVNEHGFAATTILETSDTEVNERGQMVDRHQRDLVVSGSPAQAIREHFAATRADLETASRHITLLDPVGMWATSVIKALSDAGGNPIERLHLREQNTLRTLATIERTTLSRRHEDTLKIYHAEVRAPGPENAEIPVALMERSHMTAVIIGPMQPHAIDALLVSLREATELPTWRCPHLLFMLPPNAEAVAKKVSAVVWPARVNVYVLNESLTSASSVWNAMLGMWNQMKGRPGWDPLGGASTLGAPEYPIKVADLRAAANPVKAVGHALLNEMRARRALTDALSIDGMLGCAVVDGSTGLVLARASREDQVLDMDLSAAAGAQVLRAHRLAGRDMGLADPIDEILTSAGSRQQVLRTVSRSPELFLMALLDKQRANLALARYRLAEVEKGLI